MRDANEKLTELGIKVYGVSLDSPKAQKAFAEKQNLPYELIADPDGKVVKAFGVPARGRFASRQAYLFKDGILVWRDLKASTSGQADDVLKAIEEHGK